jgi:hypothetical protein
MKLNVLRPAAAGAVALACVLGVAASPAAAQAVAKSVTSNSLTRVQKVTGHATIVAIDPATRHLTLKTEAGETDTLKAPDGMRSFDSLKVGDKITATYVRETEIVLSEPNKPPPKDAQAVVAARSAKGEMPAGVVANHIVVTGAVVGKDEAAHTLKIVSPQGGEVHNVAVSDPDGRKMLKKVKVGDKITAYVTEGLLLSASR